MKRRDLFRVRRPGGGHPKASRVFVVVSRQSLIDSRFSAVMCAPVCTRRDGLAIQVNLGPYDGLKHESSVHCDALVSLPKPLLADYVASRIFHRAASNIPGNRDCELPARC